MSFACGTFLAQCILDGSPRHCYGIHRRNTRRSHFRKGLSLPGGVTPTREGAK